MKNTSLSYYSVHLAVECLATAGAGALVAHVLLVPALAVVHSAPEPETLAAHAAGVLLLSSVLRVVGRQVSFRLVLGGQSIIMSEEPWTGIFCESLFISV